MQFAGPGSQMSAGPARAKAKHLAMRPQRRSGIWLVAVAALPALPAGCSQALPPAARQALIQAAQAQARGQCSTATANLDRIIRDHPRAPEIGEAYFVRGLCRARAGQWDAAESDFRAAVERSDRRDLIGRGRASLAMIAYRRGQWERAADLYADAVRDLPDQRPTDQILYYAGVSLQRAGRWREAALQFSRILWKFRDSPVADHARLKGAWNYQYFSVQVGAFCDTDRADAAIRAFAAKGLDARQEYRPGAPGPRWVVMTGRYPTYADAVAALDRVRRIQPDAHIIP
ncbi:MAG: hypothetical protein AMXMBFR13_01210 [Phycisphaerae bacterium]